MDKNDVELCEELYRDQMLEDKKLREEAKHDFISINYSNTREKGLYLSKDFEKLA